jgi:hypothetical protein
LDDIESKCNTKRHSYCDDIEWLGALKRTYVRIRIQVQVKISKKSLYSISKLEEKKRDLFSMLVYQDKSKLSFSNVKTSQLKIEKQSTNELKNSP